MSTLTVQTFVDNWCTQLKALFNDLAGVAAESNWTTSFTTIAVSEDPFGIGGQFEYEAPVLVLKRVQTDGYEQNITFEPRHRYTLGAAGRIAVYSYPKLREAMLLRIPETKDTRNLTLDETEDLVGTAPWKAFSTERIPLKVDVAEGDSFRSFLEDLVA